MKTRQLDIQVKESSSPKFVGRGSQHQVREKSLSLQVSTYKKFPSETFQITNPANDATTKKFLNYMEDQIILGSLTKGAAVGKLLLGGIRKGNKLRNHGQQCRKQGHGPSRHSKAPFPTKPWVLSHISIVIYLSLTQVHMSSLSHWHPLVLTFLRYF